MKVVMKMVLMAMVIMAMLRLTYFLSYMQSNAVSE